MNEQIKEISPAEIDDPKNPMRSDIDKEGVFALAESIRREGLINPITVRPRGDRYEVVAGHRRFLACKIANVGKIQCVVRDLNDDQADEIMAHENLERQDVDVVEEALLIGRLVGDDVENIAKVAERMNRSKAWVESRLEILGMPDYLIGALKEGSIKLGVASWLAAVGSDFWRKQYVDMAISNGMSITQARYLHDQWSMGLAVEPSAAIPQAEAGAPIEPPKARAECRACGRMAEAPNLQMLWAHVTCPEVNPPAAS